MEGIILLTSGSKEKIILRGREAKTRKDVNALIRALGSRCTLLRLDINSHFFEDSFGCSTENYLDRQFWGATLGGHNYSSGERVQDREGIVDGFIWSEAASAYF